MATSEYIILQRLPTPQEYYDLRKLSGMTPPPMESVPKALNGSFASFLAFERRLMLDETTPSPEQSAVGMGRLLGDGALFLQLCDVGVHPDHQGKGIGTKIMEALEKHIDQHAPDAYVSLVAEPMGMYPSSLERWHGIDYEAALIRVFWNYRPEVVPTLRV
jgi:ribosomal protein S18 acetylase RimI-like enzyme